MHHLRAPGDNSIKLAKARHLRTERAWSELRERLPLLMQKYRLQLPDQSILELAKDNDLMSEFEEVSLQIELLQGIRQPDSLGQQVHPPTHGGTQTTERDEFEALQETAPDLARLDCYERRLLSRQRRAIYNLDGLKVGV